MEQTAASKGARVLGYFIDLLPALVIGFIFGLIPIIGAIIGGVVLGAYWLLRDVAGASLGKLLLGLRVVKKGGRESDTGERVLRNLPLAIGPALLIIPIAGYLLSPAIAFIAALVELVFLLAQGERVGDKIAGTMVVRK